MKSTIVIVACFLGGFANAQELMTAALAVAMYVAGWRDGTSLQLLDMASALGGESGGEMGPLAADQESLGRCVGKLQVADLVSQLRQLVASGEISSNKSSATAALLNTAIQLCQAKTS